MPHSTAECRDVDLRRIVGVEDDAVTTLEVVAFDQRRQQQYIQHALTESIQLPRQVQKVDERVNYALAVWQSD